MERLTREERRGKSQSRGPGSQLLCLPPLLGWGRKGLPSIKMGPRAGGSGGTVIPKLGTLSSHDCVAGLYTTQTCRSCQLGTGYPLPVSLTLRHSGSTLCPWDSVMGKTQTSHHGARGQAVASLEWGLPRGTLGLGKASWRR